MPDPTRAVVQLILNDANGYLSDVLAASAQTQLEAAIDRAAVGAYFEAVFANLDTIKADVTGRGDRRDAAGHRRRRGGRGRHRPVHRHHHCEGLSAQQVAGLADAKVVSTELVTASGDAKAGSASLVTGLSTLETSASQTRLDRSAMSPPPASSSPAASGRQRVR